ncbi:MAG: lamin tail domain-containing protein [Candidatus Paceibacterota bacterium]
MNTSAKFFYGLFMGIVAFWAQLVSAATPGQVVINEFVANPSTGQEWYELINTTVSPIDLGGFKIDRTITGDSMNLSGILPAEGILVFSTSSTAVNDAGDAIILKDASSTVISAVSYGTQNYVGYPHLTSAPGSNQSGYISNTDFSNPVYSIGTPSKGWFNNATDWTCDQLNGQSIVPATNPTLSSVVTCLSFQAILTNLNSFDNPSAAIGLYFERRTDITDATPIIGKIQFSNTINLTKSETLDYLKILGNKVNISKDDKIVFVGLEGADSTIFGTINATITMYGLDGLSSAPDVIVRSDNGKVINSGNEGYPTLSGQFFDMNAHVFSFFTDRFTSFEVKKSVFTAAIEYSKDGGVTYSSNVSAKQGDTLRIRATFNDDVADVTVPQLAISSGVLVATNMTKTDERHYYIDLIIPAGKLTPTITLRLAKNMIGDAIQAVPTSGATFSINNIMSEIDKTIVITESDFLENSISLNRGIRTLLDNYDGKGIKFTIDGIDYSDENIKELALRLSQEDLAKNKILSNLVNNLRYGQSGAAIKVLQEILIDYGFLSRDYKAIGYFDQETSSAVRLYKRVYVDSLLTKQQLIEVARKIAEMDFNENTVLKTLIEQTRYDERSIRVRIMQEALKIYGFFPQNILSTGYYNGYTTLAVEACKLKYREAPEFDKDVASLGKRIGEMRLRDNSILIDLIASTNYGEKSIKAKVMQEILRSYGFFPKSIPSTGYYDGYTSSAVKKVKDFMALNKKYLAMSLIGI